MDKASSASTQQHGSPCPPSPAAHRRASSGPSLLSRLPFMRAPADARSRADGGEDDGAPAPAPEAAAAVQLHKTRRRRGSLRKVALLGRGAQRERRDGRPLIIDTTTHPAGAASVPEHDALGFKMDGFAQPAQDQAAFAESPLSASTTTGSHTTGSHTTGSHTDRDGERSNSYASTTDDDDLLQIPSAALPSRAAISVSSGSDSYFANRAAVKSRRSFQQAKSPLSYSGISSNPLPGADSDWDYSETEWWGWAVLSVTWFVFVIGMGSCLDVWSWAWDVGTTPYAPPELEDDPTLPIVGYYPALIIMTGVMAWVWVVVAWVGMKYFRHAKISGD